MKYDKIFTPISHVIKQNNLDISKAVEEFEDVFS